MIPVPGGAKVWLALGHTDMRRGMRSLALQVQQVLKKDVHAGDLYVFRGRNGSLCKILWHDGIGMSLYAKRLERGRFVWPAAKDGTPLGGSPRSRISRVARGKPQVRDLIRRRPSFSSTTRPGLPSTVSDGTSICGGCSTAKCAARSEMLVMTACSRDIRMSLPLAALARAEKAGPIESSRVRPLVPGDRHRPCPSPHARIGPLLEIERKAIALVPDRPEPPVRRPRRFLVVVPLAIHVGGLNQLIICRNAAAAAVVPDDLDRFVRRTPEAAGISLDDQSWIERQVKALAQRMAAEVEVAPLVIALGIVRSWPQSKDMTVIAAFREMDRYRHWLKWPCDKYTVRRTFGKLRRLNVPALPHRPVERIMDTDLGRPAVRATRDDRELLGRDTAMAIKPKEPECDVVIAFRLGEEHQIDRVEIMRRDAGRALIVVDVGKVGLGTTPAGHHGISSSSIRETSGTETSNGPCGPIATPPRPGE